MAHEYIFHFTQDELVVLEQLIMRMFESDPPDDMDAEAFDSLYEKVMSN